MRVLLLTRSEDDMLLIASETSKRTQSLVEIIRELSLTPAYFANAETFAELMSGHSRRIIVLCEDDVADTVIDAIESADGREQFGLIIAAHRESLRTSECAALLDRLARFRNVEWIAANYEFEEISAAARNCRRRMLKVSQKDLEDAIVKREFIVQYQPKVERSSDAVWQTREAEALLRWWHPSYGLIGPLEFLPEVEEFGLIRPISEFVLREAAGQLAEWRQRGLVLKACINLESSLLTSVSLAEDFAAIVSDSGLECSSFTFEVAEQDLADTDAPHVAMLRSLRNKGFRICLDDFRVATTSLATFQQLPFDEIKIHASALKRAQKDTFALHVLAAVTGLAHNLGIAVCAEGVEDQKTFDFLETIRCDKMQGFLISEAVMPDIMRRVYGPKAGGVDEVA